MAKAKDAGVNLLKNVKIGNRWKLHPVARDSRGRYRANHVLVDGKSQLHPEGNYHLDYYFGGRQRPSTGTGDLALAVQKATIQATLLQNERLGIKVSSNFLLTNEQRSHAAGEEGPTVSDAITKYLTAVEAKHGDNSTLKSNRENLASFLAYTIKIGRANLGAVTTEDLDGYILYIRKLPGVNKEGTVRLKVVIVAQLLKFFGRPGAFRAIPKSVDKAPPIYTEAELEKLMEHSSFAERVIFETLKQTGMRSDELATMSWSEVDFKTRLFYVRERPRNNFTPNNRIERVIPMTDVVATLLEHWKQAQPPRYGNLERELVFGTEHDTPQPHLLRWLKAVAWKAGLNCGRCVKSFPSRKRKNGRASIAVTHRCAEGPHCENFFLHKFRHTYATVLLRSGVDIRDLQQLLGHTSLTSTMVYLRGSTAEHLVQKVNSGALAGYGQALPMIVRSA